MDIINEATGSVASFITNRAMPLASIKSEFSASQDLNGYDKPWPPCDGKNLFDINTAIPGYIVADGTRINAPDLENMVSDYIPITEGVTYTYSFYPSAMNDSWTGWAFYTDKDMSTVVGSRHTITGQTTTTVVPPSGAKYIRIGSRYLMNDGSAQFEKGTSATDWVPCSNICPINGITETKITHSNKNLIKNIVARGQTVNYVYLGQSNYNAHDTYLKAGTYTISYKTTGLNKPSIYMRQSGVSGNVKLCNYDTKATFTLENDNFYRFWLYRSDGINVEDISEPQIEFGTEVTAWEPYNSESETISVINGIYLLYPEYAPYFQGLLAGTHDFVQLSGLSWYAVAVTGAGNRFYANRSDAKPPADTSSEAHIICSKYKTKPVSQYNQAVDGITIYTNRTIQVYDSNLKELSNTAFKATMSKVYAIYELDTPKTPTITPDQFKTLLYAFGATCYGGNIEIDQYGRRKAVVTHKIMSIPHDVVLKSGTWNPSTGSGKFYYIAGVGNIPSDWDNSENNNGVICDTLPLSNVSTSSTKSGIIWYTNWIVRWIDTARMSMTLADYKNYLSTHPIKCMYKLKTPLVIDLPDGEIFTSFIGHNNVFCNTGDTTVQYYISVVMDSVESNLIPGGDIKSINVSQNDAGRKVRVSLFDNSVVYDIPSGYVVTGKILTPNHEIVDVEVDDIGDSYVDITIPEEAVSSCGTAMCKLRVKDSEEHPLYDVGFSVFFIEVEAQP